MAVGGIVLPKERYLEVSAEIQRIKNTVPVCSELKWTKYKGGSREPIYKFVVDALFLMIKEKQAAFHCLIAEFGEFSHKSSNGGTPESSVSRMYYQLLVHRICKIYGKDHQIYVHPDKGDDGSELVQFIRGINAVGSRKYGSLNGCIKCIEQHDSEKNNILQVTDIILGSIAAHRNKRHEIQGCSKHKKDLAEYILHKAGRTGWEYNSPLNEHFMTVWNFKHQRR